MTGAVVPGFRPEDATFFGAHTTQGKLNRARALLVVLGVVCATIVFAWFADDIVTLWPGAPLTGPQAAFLVALVLLPIALVAIGWMVTGYAFGVFIDSRNRYGIEKVQAVAWFVIVSAAAGALAVSNFRNGMPSPLAIRIPAELLEIIGLSVTTAVGTSIIRSVKRSNKAASTSPGWTTSKDRRPHADLDGTLVVFDGPDKTGWADLVSGEETSNWLTVDVGKLQLLYFSVLGLFVYGAAIYSAMAGAGQLEFPKLDSGFVGILALSNVGALAYQAAPHAKTEA